MADSETDPQINREEGEEEDPETELLGERVDQENGQIRENSNDPAESTINNEQGMEEEGTDNQDPPSNDVVLGEQTGTTEDKESTEEPNEAAEDKSEVVNEPQVSQAEENQSQDESNLQRETETQDPESAIQDDTPKENAEEPSPEDGNDVDNTEGHTEAIVAADATPKEHSEVEGENQETLEPQNETPAAGEDSEGPAIQGTEEQDKEPLEEPEQEKEVQEKVGSPVAIPTATPEPDTDNVGTGTEPTEDKHETDPHAPSPVSRYDQNATATGMSFITF